MILNGRNIDGLRAPRIATLTRRRFVAGAACAVACAAAGLLVGCGPASESANVASIEPYVSPYDWSGLVRDGEKLAYYENDALCSRWGIDVSEHQGNDIDWAAVADAGVQFAFARIGNRGATEGALSADEFFFQNAIRAGEVGIQVSAYFFSQALTEDEAREEAQFALDNLRETEGYSDSKGLFSARKAIMQYAQLKNIPNVTIDDIYTGNGVSELINLSMSALLDTGDEVLVPSPDYPLWTACVNLAGGTAVHYLCDEQSEWYPDIDDIRSKITSNTKAIVIINPNNPTGALYPKEVLQQIVDIAREHQLIIFSDEIYDRLVMDGLQHISIASMAPDLFCVTFSGLSKSHMIAGYRIGWMILSGNKRIAKDYIEGLNMLANMRMCSNVPAQSVVQTALGGHQSVNDYIVPGGRVHDQRDLVYDMLNQIPGITAVKPKAAFYIFPKIDVKRFNIHSDEQFALDLLHDKHILISHGGAFNWHRPDHFRVVYLPRMGMLRETMGEISDFFSYYWQS